MRARGHGHGSCATLLSSMSITSTRRSGAVFACNWMVLSRNHSLAAAVKAGPSCHCSQPPMARATSAIRPRRTPVSRKVVRRKPGNLINKEDEGRRTLANVEV